MRFRTFIPAARRIPMPALALERLDDRIVPATWTTDGTGLPILHSRPAAPTAIYLDFNGDTTTATTAYSEDADGTTFNLSEQTNIYECWRQMAAYYAMFDVDVTTVAPATSFPKVWMVEGNNISGGYSYVGVFPNSKPESFNEMSDTQSRVSGIAHEAGHNWGLSHQSAYNLFADKTAEYIGQLDALHGPIMGVDFGGQVHKFIIGHPSSSPSTLQDDLAVIAAKIKTYQTTGTIDGYAPDDYAGTIAAATPLAANGGVQSTFGIVERRTDTDMFSFTASGRTFVGVTPDYPSSLDARIEIYDGAGNLVAAADDPSNDQHVTLDLPAGTYYLLVAGHGNYADIGGYNVKVAAGVPSDWSSMDVGGVAKAGASTFDTASGTYTISGGGSDIWNTADEFQYAWRTLSGNGSITARVDTITASNSFSKAGVMIRESTAAGAKNVALLATPTGGYQAQVRSSTGGGTSQINTATGAFAVKYVRITRSGNTFTTAVSTNGTTFSTVATYTVSMNADVLVGLAVTSKNDEEERATVGITDVPTVNTATFSQLAIVGSLTAVPATNALAAPTALTAAPTAGGGFTLAWTGSTGAAGYTVERSANGVDFATAGTTAAGVVTYTDGALAGSLRYFYRVRATDATGRSVPSDPANAFNRPSAVTGLAVTAWQTDKVILNWRDTTGETGYRVERSTDNATWTTLSSTVGVNVPSYTATGLTANTVYYFRVTPLSALGDGTAATATGSTRLPAVTGLTITGTTTTQISLSWTAVSGATGYRIDRSTDGTTFTTLTTTTTPATTTYANTGLTPGGEYYYRVYAVNSATGGLSALGTTVFAAAVAVNPLPPGWSSQDIGAVGGTGAAGFSNGTFTVTGSGADIWNAADAFRYTYQTLSGNGTITAKVLTAEDTDVNAKIGVMIRESLAANSKYSMLAVTGENGLYLQSRTTTGGSGVTNANTAGIAAPYWVRLTRAGNVVTAYSSTDGVTWTTVGTSTLSSLATNVYIGLAVTAHNNALLNTSTFNNVTVGPPRVLATKVNDGQTDLTQRSRVTGLTVTFNTPVTLAAQSAGVPTFTLTGTNVAGNAISIPATGIVVTNPSGDGQTYRLTFTGAGIETGSIPDGSWALNVAAAAVTAAGTPMAANYVSRTSGVGITRLFGDVTGDGFVDAADFSRFGTALGSLTGDPTYDAALDWNQDTFVDATDYSQFSSRLGLAVFADVTPQAPLPVAAPAVAPRPKQPVIAESLAGADTVTFAPDLWPTNDETLFGNLAGTGAAGVSLAGGLDG